MEDQGKFIIERAGERREMKSQKIELDKMKEYPLSANGISTNERQINLSASEINHSSNNNHTLLLKAVDKNSFKSKVIDGNVFLLTNPSLFNYPPPLHSSPSIHFHLPFTFIIKRKYLLLVSLIIFNTFIIFLFCHSIFIITMNSLASNMFKCTLAAMVLQPVLCAPLWIPPSYFSFPFKNWWNRNDPTTITTPLGTVNGANMGSNVVRFTLPFAQAPIGDLRFANPQPITSFNGYNASQMPPSCYQGPDVRGEAPPSEDCLYSTYYVPIQSQSSSVEPLPFMVWYHGGSGIVGSATQDGLDATQWASSQNVIVVVPQYRLNLFGWLSTNTTLDENVGGTPGSSTVAGNQAIRDVVAALQQIPFLAQSMNGDSSKVTIMGQSSGATMMRALLTTPIAQTLFQNAYLVSDPMDYGLSSIDDNNFLGQMAMEYLNCTTIQCARQVSPQAILNATNVAYTYGPQQNQRISGGTPWRAMVGDYVTSSLATTQKVNKNIILSTVQNEMGSLTGADFVYQPAGATTLSLGGSPISLPAAANLVFNQNRGQEAANDGTLYQVNETEADGMRITFEELATDGIWRCAVQNMADLLSEAGSKVWLEEWQIGATYASNVDNSYCTSDQRVCHEDNIYMIFNTIPTTPTIQQKQASVEMQTRYSNFAKQNIPGAPNAVSWQPVSSSNNLNILLVGQDGSTSINQTQHAPACSGQAWGNAIKFDWQIYPV